MAINNQCTITNSSGKDVIVAAMLSQNETGGSNAIVLPGNTMEILKTSNGQTIIKNGTSGIVTLDHTYKTSSGGSGSVQSYNLVICEAGWLNPVALLPVELQSNSENYPPQTITATNPAVNQAFKFYQTLWAYPSSKLATDYLKATQAAKEAALNNTDGDSVALAGTIEKTMETFFKSTTEYRQVTLADVTAVSTYYNNFPAVWAQYKDSITYYLYGTAGTVASFLGTLSLKKQGSLDIAKPNGGYTCAFAPALTPANMDSTAVDSTKAVSLQYQDGLFVDDVKATAPKIALRGSFLIGSLLTQNPDDIDVWTIITGNVNGTLCVGLDTAQHSIITTAQPKATAAALTDTNANVVAFWNKLTHPQSLTDWVITIATFVSAVLVIPAISFAVYRIYKLVKFRAQVRETLTQQTIKDEVNTLEQNDTENRIKWTGDPKLEDRDVADHYGLDLGLVEEIALKGQVANSMSGMFRLQSLAIKEMLQYQSVMGADDITAMESLLTSIRKLEVSTGTIIEPSIFKQPELLKQKLQEVDTVFGTLTEYQTKIDETFKKIKDSIKQESAEDVQAYSDLISGGIFDIKTNLEQDRTKAKEESPEVKEVEPFEF